MRHCEETELERYRDGQMEFFQRLLCRIHLRHCAICRERLETMNADDLLLKDLKNVMSPDGIPENDQTYRDLCNHFQDDKGSTI